MCSQPRAIATPFRMTCPTLNSPTSASGAVGLSYNYRDDHEMLKHGLVVYDALYAWCRHTRGETHTWNPAALGAYGAKVA